VCARYPRRLLRTRSGRPDQARETLAADDDRAYVVAARGTLAPESAGRHENAKRHASPDGEATLRRPAPQRLDSYAGVMDRPRAACHRSSRVGRRAEMRPQPSRCLKEKETKRRSRHVPRLSLRPSTRRKRQRSCGRSRVHSSDSYRGGHDNRAWCRRFGSVLHRRLENPAVIRDFGPRNGETRTRTGDTTIFSRYLEAARRREIPGHSVVSAKQGQRREVRNLQTFPGDCGNGGRFRPS
jgi:hypothetical protein